MYLVLLGPPGAGKGTQAARIEAAYALPHIATGDIFRKNIKEKTELGKKAKEYIDQGKLVPDKVTIGMVKDRLAKDDCQNGFILDGFPRTVQQADALEEILRDLELSLDAIINIQVSDEEVISRLSGRRVCKECGATFHIKFNAPQKEGICDECGGELYQRDDDTPSTIKERLEVYSKQTAPLVQYYQQDDILEEINGEQSLEDVYNEINSRLERLK